MRKRKPKYDRQGKLMDKIFSVIREHDWDAVEVHGKTGLPYHWLASLLSGRIKNPSVNRMEFLYEKLTGNKMTV